MEENTNTVNQTAEAVAGRVIVKMNDDLIGMVRELVQLSLLTGTNLIDHMRAMVLELTPDRKNVTVTPEYVDAYNTMVEDLNKQALERANLMAETEDLSPLLANENN